ncbi:MAG: heavy metal-binding domain-containing protein [Anaerolineaceae bacterium]|nr:heavy metal-binding domain-containing protein [Anaerolineaceae bacterium]
MKRNSNMRKCPYCNNEIDEFLKKCPVCNRSLVSAPISPTISPNKPRHDSFNPEYHIEYREKCSICGKTAEVTVQHKKYCRQCLQPLLKEIIVTTTHSVEGYEITDYIDIESAEVVIGTGFVSEWITDIQDTFGGRSTLFEQKLAEAKSLTLSKIKHAALLKGGNAVVGMDVDYTEFTGNRIGVIISGTVVKIAKLEP